MGQNGYGLLLMLLLLLLLSLAPRPRVPTQLRDHGRAGRAGRARSSPPLFERQVQCKRSRRHLLDVHSSHIVSRTIPAHSKPHHRPRSQRRNSMGHGPIPRSGLPAVPGPEQPAAPQCINTGGAHGDTKRTNCPSLRRRALSPSPMPPQPPLPCRPCPCPCPRPCRPCPCRPCPCPF